MAMLRFIAPKVKTCPEGLERVKAETWRLLTELPLDGGLQLLRLERAVRDKNEGLRRLRVALSDKRRALLRLPSAGGRPADEQRNGADDSRKRNKVQDDPGIQ